MESKASRHKRRKEEKIRIKGTSKGSSDESKNEKYKEINHLTSNTPASRRMMGDLESCNTERNIKSKPVEFRPLYEELDPEYYLEEAVLMKIIPERDGREKVRDTTIYPFSAHGRLVMMFNGFILYGSGTLISSRYVLTAAHNLYSHRFGREPDSIEFIPALNGTKCPYGIIGVKRFFYSEEYKAGESDDYGLLELEEDIGDNTGIIEMKVLEEIEINNLECSIYGYPGYIKNVENKLQYGMSGLISLNENTSLIKYEIDTSMGQSGSSIYYHSLLEDKYFTIGVHVRGFLEKGYNEGTLLTTKRIGKIREWMGSKMIDTKHNLEGPESEIYGRDLYFDRIRDYFATHEKFGVIALCGVGGVGKSTIARKFGLESIGTYDYIWWIESETEDSFNSSIVSLFETLKIQGNTFQDKLKNLRVHMNSKKDRFLFIFDNLEDESIARRLIGSKGHFIITTRLEQNEHDYIEVTTLSSEASVQLLLSRLPDKSNEDLLTLANFLQDLPLALIQSASYIRRSRIEVRDYIEYFSSNMNRDDKLKNIVSKNIESLVKNLNIFLK